MSTLTDTAERMAQLPGDVPRDAVIVTRNLQRQYDMGGEIVRALRGADVGEVVAPRDHRALAGALHRLVTQPDAERRATGQRGRELVRTTFDQPIITRKVEQVYEVVLGMRDPGDVDLPSPGADDGLIAPRPAIR